MLYGVWLVVAGWVCGYSVALAQTKTVSATDLEAGKKLYSDRCMHCHGEQGDGKGVSTPFVYPKPRDFTSGAYKFRTRHENENGIKLPADADIFRSIKEGLHGTSMPGWGNFYTDQQINQLVQYIKTFSSTFQEEKLGAALNFGGEISFSPESVARGKQLFEGDELQCYTCHGTAGRGNGQRALEKKGLQDDWGDRIWPANLTRPWTYRGGHGRQDIFRNVVMGIRGTPMDAFIEPYILEVLRATDAQQKKEAEKAAREAREKAWHVVNYVQSVWTYPDEPAVKSVLTAKRQLGTLPASPDDPAWKEVPANYYPLVGQVIEGERLFTPMVVGIEIQALHNGTDIAFRMVWDDRTESKPGESEGSETFVDAMALQFPAKPLQGEERPYFLMGDSKNPTDLWYWRNDNLDAAVLVQTTGYKSFRPGDNPGGIRTKGIVDNGQYRVVMQRTLNTANAGKEAQFAVGSFFPFTVTVWDGSNGERGGDRRTVAAWYNLYLEPEPSKTPIYLLLTGIAIGVVLEFSALYVTYKNHA